MYGDLETFQTYWKDIQDKEVAVDTKACNAPCFLSAVHLTAGTGRAATATLRDGHDASGEIKLQLAALTSAADIRQFTPPIYFKQGLFVDVGSNVTSCFVQFLKEKPRNQAP